MAASYHQLGNVACLRRRLDEAEDWYRKSLAIREDLGDRPGIAATYGQLGMTAQERGRLEEAEDWYRKSLAIFEDSGDRPGLAATYGQFGLLVEQRGQPRQALDWMVRCVTVFEQFPHPKTDPVPEHLARLTGPLGNGALEASWREVTGGPLPQAVRDYIRSARPAASGGQPEGYGWQLPDKEDLYRQTLAAFEELGDRPAMVGAYGMLGMTAQEQGRLEEAEDWFRKALAISDELRDRPLMATCYHELYVLPTCGAAGRGRRLVPQVPYYLRGAGGPGPRSRHLRISRPSRRAAGTAPPGPGLDGPVHHHVRAVPPPEDSPCTKAPRPPDRPTRQRSLGSQLAGGHRPPAPPGRPQLRQLQPTQKPQKQKQQTKTRARARARP